MSWESRLRKKLKSLQRRLGKKRAELEMLRSYTMTVLGEALPLTAQGPCLVLSPTERRARLLPLYRRAKKLARQHKVRSLVLMHRCDNNPCCEESHITFGTPSDNYRDAILKGRTRHATALHQREERMSVLSAEVAVLEVHAVVAEWVLNAAPEEVARFFEQLHKPVDILLNI